MGWTASLDMGSEKWLWRWLREKGAFAIERNKDYGLTRHRTWRNQG